MRKLVALVISLVAAVCAVVLVVPASAGTMTITVPRPPMGHVDSARSSSAGNSVLIRGWALDPSARDRPAAVEVTIDGKTAAVWQSAAVLRTDVNRSYHATGGHGFAISVTVPIGNHTVCVNTRLRSAVEQMSLGCFTFQANPIATKAQMLAAAKTIDPMHTLSWNWASLPAGTNGLAMPWSNSVQISASIPVQNLRSVMLLQWAYVLQYRAYGSAWWNAVQAFNELLGDNGDRQSYAGIDAGASCIASALGATQLTQACPAALRVFSARIARGVAMDKPQGNVDAVTASGSVVTVTGWTIDPTQPNTSNPSQITDNGQPVTGSIATSALRADINKATGVTGRHGFTMTTKLTPGSHQICVLSHPLDTNRAAVTLAGCRTVQIASGR